MLEVFFIPGNQINTIFGGARNHVAHMLLYSTRLVGGRHDNGKCVVSICRDLVLGNGIHVVVAALLDILVVDAELGFVPS